MKGELMKAAKTDNTLKLYMTKFREKLLLLLIEDELDYIPPALRKVLQLNIKLPLRLRLMSDKKLLLRAKETIKQGHGFYPISIRTDEEVSPEELAYRYFKMTNKLRSW